jgi:malate dehydrogenase
MGPIAIIGAGELGGAIAHTLARRNIAASIRLIDDRGRVADGKALDIMQAAPIEGFATVLTASTSVADAGGSALVVIADRAAGGEWTGEEAVQLLARLSELTSGAGAVFLCPGASQRELVDRGVSELHIDRRRLFGSAPEALAGAARALVALAIDGSAQDVALSVVGVPPAQFVVPWEDATVAGFRVTKLIDEPTRRRLGRQVAAAWPPGPYALAAAAAKAVDALFGRTRAVVSCFVAPEDMGRRARTSAMPVRLTSNGIAGIVLPSLDVVDRVALDNATQL